MTRSRRRLLTILLAVTAVLCVVAPLAYLAVVVAAAAAIRSDSAELRMVGWAATGNIKHCSPGQIYRGLREFHRQQAVVEQIHASSRVVGQDGNLALWETPHGQFWISASDDLRVLSQILSEQVLDIYPGVRRGDVVFDCGAHYGFFSRRALAAGASRVIAAEPFPSTAECFRRNLRNEIDAGRVTLIEKAVWHEDDTRPLQMDSIRSWQNSFVLTWNREESGLRLPLTTIDHISSDLALARVDFIKMDIEGSERNALIGATSTIAKHHPRMAIAAYHVPDDPVVLPEIVRKAGAYSAVECPTCKEYGGIRPDVMHFVP